jgi:cytochrome P450
MSSLTLEVVGRTLFGTDVRDEVEIVSQAQNELLKLFPSLLTLRGMLGVRVPGRLRRTLRRESERLDGVVERVVATRRESGDAGDVVSLLLAVRDEETGERMPARQVRDEVLTLLLAGHETTATALAWTFDLLLHTPDVLARALDGDEAYLDAVAKEALRLRPVIPAVGRVVRAQPFALGDYEIPVGLEINPSIRIVHARGDLYPQPRAFRPERFLTDDAPDTYTWLPFGGGTRRCLGASFALMEMRVVLARVLERVGLRLQAASPKLERAHLRTITLGPRRGVRVRLDSPGPGC